MIFAGRSRFLAPPIFLAAALLTIGLVVRFAPMPDRSLMNHQRVMELLSQACPVFAPTAPHQVMAVRLPGEPTLTPERCQVFAGYTLIAHVRKRSFTVAAMPVAVGKSGAFSLFRDEQGVIRIQPKLGTPADENSRPWGGPPVPDTRTGESRR
jgi:hypothetical protein